MLQGYHEEVLVGREKWRNGDDLEVLCPHMVSSPALCVWCSSVLPHAVMRHRAVCEAQGGVCIPLPSGRVSCSSPSRPYVPSQCPAMCGDPVCLVVCLCEMVVYGPKLL